MTRRLSCGSASSNRYVPASRVLPGNCTGLLKVKCVGVLASSAWAGVAALDIKAATAEIPRTYRMLPLFALLRLEVHGVRHPAQRFQREVLVLKRLQVLQSWVPRVTRSGEM